MADAQDGWGGMPNGWGRRGNYGNPPSLQQHDQQFHGGSYNGGACKYRDGQKSGDDSDILPGFGSLFSNAPVTARHGMFDTGMTRLSPQEQDQAAVKSVCTKLGVKYPGKGVVQSGRWQSASDSKLEYTVVDSDTGLFASGRGTKDYMVLARPEEAMSFSAKEDAEAVAKATGPKAMVLDKKAYKAFVSRKAVNNVTFPSTLNGNDLKGFRVTMNGSTEPYVGKINGSMFIAKKGSHTSADHVRNEDIANRLHLEAGLNAPKSRIYEVDGDDDRSEAEKYMDMINGVTGKHKETVMLAEYIPNAISLEAAWNDAKKNKDAATIGKIRKQVLEAYPFESFVAGIDLFQNDNALVDSDGKLWMVDNGAAFDFRARGGRKGWFNTRTDPNDKQNGLMSMVNHPSQTLLRDIMKGYTERDVLDAAAKYDFEGLAKKLPKEYQTPGLMEYARKLNEMSGRNGNGKKSPASNGGEAATGSSVKPGKYDDNSDIPHRVVLTLGDYEDADADMISDMERALGHLGATGIKSAASEDEGEGVVICTIPEGKLNKLSSIVDEDGAWEMEVRRLKKGMDGKRDGKSADNNTAGGEMKRYPQTWVPFTMPRVWTGR